MLNLEELAVNPEFTKKELESGLRTPPTLLQHWLTLDIQDYRLKCTQKRQSNFCPAFALL
jgi:hypothetical protein